MQQLFHSTVIPSKACEVYKRGHLGMLEWNKALQARNSHHESTDGSAARKGPKCKFRSTPDDGSWALKMRPLTYMTRSFLIRRPFSKIWRHQRPQGFTFRKHCFFYNAGPMTSQKKIVLNFHHLVCYGQPLWFWTIWSNSATLSCHQSDLVNSTEACSSCELGPVGRPCQPLQVVPVDKQRHTLSVIWTPTTDTITQPISATVAWNISTACGT